MITLIMRNKIFVFILINLILVSAEATSIELCFTKHLLEATKINKQRQITYARLEDPFLTSVDSLRSIATSQAMIQAQQSLLTNIAPGVDALSLLIKKDHNVHISCLSFVSMDNVGDMENLPRPKSRRKMKRIDILEWQNNLKNLIYKQNLDQLESLILNLNQMIRTLNYPEYNCMVRHLLESTQRIAKVGTTHQNLMKQDQRANELIWKMIQAHVLGLAPAYALDKTAEPLQRDGIPIICNDVPTIP